MDKEQKAQKLAAWKAQQRAIARDALPMPDESLKALFDILDRALQAGGCDHTRRLTQSWLEANAQDLSSATKWLDDTRRDTFTGTPPPLVAIVRVSERYPQQVLSRIFRRTLFVPIVEPDLNGGRADVDRQSEWGCERIDPRRAAERVVALEAQARRAVPTLLHPASPNGGRHTAG
jgi:hypothetical protein